MFPFEGFLSYLSFPFVSPVSYPHARLSTLPSPPLVSFHASLAVAPCLGTTSCRMRRPSTHPLSPTLGWRLLPLPHPWIRSGGRHTPRERKNPREATSRDLPRQEGGSGWVGVASTCLTVGFAPCGWVVWQTIDAGVRLAWWCGCGSIGCGTHSRNTRDAKGTHVEDVEHERPRKEQREDEDVRGETRVGNTTPRNLSEPNATQRHGTSHGSHGRRVPRCVEDVGTSRSGNVPTHPKRKRKTMVRRNEPERKNDNNPNETEHERCERQNARVQRRMTEHVRRQARTKEWLTR